MAHDDIDAAKRRASESAIDSLKDETIIGLGSGSTAKHAIEILGAEVNDGREVLGIPTSHQSRELAIEEGIQLTSLAETNGSVDVVIDGADQFHGSNLIKGGGAAHAREKIVGAAADRYLVVVDTSKESNGLDEPIPVEVLPNARATVRQAVERLGGNPELRDAIRKAGPVVTDNGNFVLDCSFGSISSPEALATDLATLPGVVEHGLFLDYADEIHLGTDEGVEVTRF